MARSYWEWNRLSTWVRFSINFCLVLFGLPSNRCRFVAEEWWVCVWMHERACRNVVCLLNFSTLVLLFIKLGNLWQKKHSQNQCSKLQKIKSISPSQQKPDDIIWVIFSNFGCSSREGFTGSVVLSTISELILACKISWVAFKSQFTYSRSILSTDKCLNLSISSCKLFFTGSCNIWLGFLCHFELSGFTFPHPLEREGEISKNQQIHKALKPCWFLPAEHTRNSFCPVNFSCQSADENSLCNTSNCDEYWCLVICVRSCLDWNKCIWKWSCFIREA